MVQGLTPTNYVINCINNNNNNNHNNNSNNSHTNTATDTIMTMNVYGVSEESPYFNHTPLAALTTQTKQQLARMLNCKKVLPSEEGYERDWRGLAALAKQKSFCSAIQPDNPIEKLLQFWILNNPEKAKIGYLQQYLGVIDRWDVCDDIYENLQRDTTLYEEKQKRLDLKQKYSQSYNNAFENDGCNGGGDQFSELDPSTSQYDAFILYADNDIEKAVEIMKQLEDSVYNFKIYLKERDMLAGIAFEHVELVNLIEVRCKHLIVVLTEDFLRSPENAFLINYTQQLQIRENLRKIIPIIYKVNMSIPKTLRIYTHLKYNGNVLFNFWDKLAKSLLQVEVLSPYMARDVHTPTAPPALEHEQQHNHYNEEKNDTTDMVARRQHLCVENLNPLRAAQSEGQLISSGVGHGDHSNHSFAISTTTLSTVPTEDTKKRETWSRKFKKILKIKKKKEPILEPY